MIDAYGIVIDSPPVLAAAAGAPNFPEIGGRAATLGAAIGRVSDLDAAAGDWDTAGWAAGFAERADTSAGSGFRLKIFEMAPNIRLASEQTTSHNPRAGKNVGKLSFPQRLHDFPNAPLEGDDTKQ